MKPQDPLNAEQQQAPFPKERKTGASETRKKKSFVERLKKIGFSVWIAVMVIGGILAFLTSLLLL